MKLVNFKKAGANALGVVTGRGIVDASAFAGPGTPVTMAEALAMGREAALAALEPVVQQAGAFLSPDQIAFAPASDAPEKILCVGKNYAAHAAEVPELFKAPPGSPEIFCKFRNTLVPHGGKVRADKYAVPRKDLLGDAAGDAQRRRQAAGKMPPAAHIRLPAPFDPRGIIRVRGARLVGKLRVV